MVQVLYLKSEIEVLNGLQHVFAGRPTRRPEVQQNLRFHLSAPDIPHYLRVPEGLKT